MSRLRGSLPDTHLSRSRAGYVARVALLSAFFIGVGGSDCWGWVAGQTTPDAGPSSSLSSDTHEPSKALRGRRTPKAASTIPAGTAKYLITGRVVNAVSGSPVANCHLSASPTSDRRTDRRFESRNVQEFTAAADADGRFEIAIPSPGGWSLTATARGYRTQALDEHDGYSTAVVLSEADPTFALTFPLTPAAAIEGFVLDDGGEAVRNGQVTLTFLPSATPEEAHPRGQVRDHQRTDDRGYYKFQGIAAGNYEVSVHADPWYATAARRSGMMTFDAVTGRAATASGNEPPDPLDVVYPTVWYPGVIDHSAATPIAMHGGETREADFRMLPVPGFHLKIPAGPPSANQGGQPEGISSPRISASVSELLPDGSEAGVRTQMRTDANGDTDIEGLKPGSYIVRLQGQGSDGSSASTLVQIGPNSARTVDLSQGTPGTTVTVRTDPYVDVERLQIRFRNVESGNTNYAEFENGHGRRAMRQHDQASESSPAAERKEGSRDLKVTLQPGRYEVFLSGVADLHLVSISATEAAAAGRVVTIAEGSPVLTLHVAAGRGKLKGTVSSGNSPDAGAMVLVVPATLGSPSGLNVPRRDQSNSDGSFEISGILPGAYILVAIDRGWALNWTDPEVLKRFLQQGTPLEIKPSSDLNVTVKAQSP